MQFRTKMLLPVVIAFTCARNSVSPLGFARISPMKGISLFVGNFIPGGASSFMSFMMSVRIDWSILGSSSSCGTSISLESQPKWDFILKYNSKSIRTDVRMQHISRCSTYWWHRSATALSLIHDIRLLVPPAPNHSESILQKCISCDKQLGQFAPVFGSAIVLFVIHRMKTWKTKNSNASCGCFHTPITRYAINVVKSSKTSMTVNVEFRVRAVKYWIIRLQRWIVQMW